MTHTFITPELARLYLRRAVLEAQRDAVRARLMRFGVAVDRAWLSDEYDALREGLVSVDAQIAKLEAEDTNG